MKIFVLSRLSILALLPIFSLMMPVQTAECGNACRKTNRGGVGDSGRQGGEQVQGEQASSAASTTQVTQAQPVTEGAYVVEVQPQNVSVEVTADDSDSNDEDGIPPVDDFFVAHLNVPAAGVSAPSRRSARAVTVWYHEEPLTMKAFVSAVRNGNEVTINQCIEAEMPIRHCPATGSTPLLEALKLGRLDIAKRIVAYCPDSVTITHEVTDYTPTHRLVEFICRQSEKRGDLHYELQKGDDIPEESKESIELLRKFIELRGSISTNEVSGGKAPLHIACEKGCVLLVQALLATGMPGVNVRDLKLLSLPLHFALRNGHWRVARLLLNAASEVDTPSGVNGKTPLYELALYCACHLGSYFSDEREGQILDVLHLLLSGGANVLAGDLEGSTPSDFAEHIENESIREIFARALRNTNS